MSSFRLSRRADRDLYDILVFGYEHFGLAQADAYIAGMEHVFKLLADNPRMGRAADAIAPGVRRHEYRSHIILYEEASVGIVILAIVHGSSVRRLSLP